jgi:hypothetical protein
MYVNVKMVPAETIPGIGKRRKENGVVEFTYDIVDIL